MKMRQRKLLGTVLMLTLVIVWSLLAMALAQAPVIASSRLIQFVYYLVAGVGWVLPAMPLISWMSRPDAEPDHQS